MKLPGIAFLVFFVTGCSSAGLSQMQDSAIVKLPEQQEVVVMHFWATWCQPCLAEIPALNRLHSKFSRARFIGISMDAVENQGAIHSFLKEHPIDYEVVLRSGQDFQKMASSLDPDWKEGLPATFVFRDGKRIFSSLGMLDENAMDSVLSKATGN